MSVGSKKSKFPEGSNYQFRDFKDIRNSILLWGKQSRCHTLDLRRALKSEVENMKGVFT